MCQALIIKLRSFGAAVHPVDFHGTKLVGNFAV
jgi:hypothetical protein